MAIDRRQLLTAMLAGLMGQGGARAEALGQRLYLSCRFDAGEAAAVACFDAAGNEVFATSLPARGHDVTRRPGHEEAAVFARRPGNWFAVVGLAQGELRAVVHSPEGRHLYGHGAYTADGRLLHVTENDLATGDGWIAVYDAGAGYRRLGAFPSGGIGPHDLALLPDGRTLVVANGGLRTSPETGREVLNPGDLAPNLALVDLRHGEVIGTHALPGALHQLSIRHLAVRRDGLVAFGCQYQGDAGDLPPLAGTLSPDGAVRVIDLGEDALARLDNYVGSVSFDDGGDFLAVTSPKGGAAVVWDMRRGRLAASLAMADVCGVAAAGEAGFLLSSGAAGLERAVVAPRLAVTPVPVTRWIWDNHMIDVRAA